MMTGDWQVFFDVWIAAIARASWHGAIAIGLVWAVCRAVPRLSPNVRCWLWRLALLKTVLALVPLGSLDVPVLPRSWSVVPIKIASADADSAAAPVNNDQQPARAALALPPPGSSTAPATIASPRAAAMAVPTARIPWALAVLFAVWLAVVCGFLGLLAAHVRAARRGRGQWRLIKDHGLLTLNERLAGQMGLFQPPVLFESEACETPVVFGALRTSVILPSSLVAQSTPGEMRLILAHEMAHIRRWDLLGNWLSSLVSALFFFHPLVWLALRECQLDTEMACDELAVRQPDASVGDYGRLLVDLATRFRRVGLPVATVGVVESFQVLLKRRLRALGTLGNRSRGSRAASWLLAGVAVIGLLPWRLVAAVPADSCLPSTGLAAGQGSSRTPLDDRLLATQCRDRAIDVQTTAGPFIVKGERVRQCVGDHFVFAGVPSGLPSGAGESPQTVNLGLVKPNLILELSIKGPKLDDGRQWLYNVMMPIRATDDAGRKCECSQCDGMLRLWMRGIDYLPGEGRAAIHLRVPSDGPKPRQLRSVEATLLAIEARVNQLVFDRDEVTRLLERTPGERPMPVVKAFSSSRGSSAVTLTDVDRVPDGFNVLLGVPWTPGSGEDTPEYRNKLYEAAGRMNLVLRDSRGQWHTMGFRYQSSQDWGPTFSVCDGNLRLTLGDWSSRPAYPCALKRSSSPMLMYQFHFDPLPDGVTVDSFTCTVVEHVGRPQAHRIRLEDIPLPDVTGQDSHD